jgi:hypothetical protein
LKRPVTATLVLVAASCLLSGWTAITRQRFDLVTSLRIAGSFSLPQGGYHILDEPDRLVVQLSLTNVSDEPLVLPEGFADEIVIDVRSDDSVAGVESERRVSWKMLGKAPDGARLSKGDTALVTLTVRPSARQVFALGTYSVVVDLRRLGPRLTAGDGAPWNGTFQRWFQKPMLISVSTTREEWILGRAFRAQSYEAGDDPGTAKSIYLSLVREAPTSPAGSLGLARLEMQQRRFPEAARWYERVVELGEPREGGAWRSLAMAYVGAGEGAKARAVLLRNLPADRVEAELSAMGKGIAQPQAR